MASTALERVPVRDRSHRSVPGLAGVVLAAVALAATAGPSGLAAGILLVVVWALVSVPFVLAVGHIVALVLFPSGMTVEAFVLVEAGFLLVLAGQFVRRGVERRVVAAAVLVAVALLSAVAASLQWFDSILAAAIVLGLAGTVGAYGLHRYELYTLGLVEP